MPPEVIQLIAHNHHHYITLPSMGLLFYLAAKINAQREHYRIIRTIAMLYGWGIHDTDVKTQSLVLATTVLLGGEGVQQA